MWSVILVLLFSIASSAIQAANVNWTIDFFDAFGDQVGNGTFSYDPATTDTFRYGDTPEPGDQSREFTTTTALTSLDWNFDNGRHWSLSGEVWWVGSVWYSRYGSSLGPFHLGDQRFGPFLMLSSATQVDENTFMGEWQEFGPGGTWVASTPVPGTLILFASGLFAMLGYRKKTSRLS